MAEPAAEAEGADGRVRDASSDRVPVDQGIERSKGEPMRVLAIDPGTTQSGYVLYDGKVITAGVMDNGELLQIVRDDRSDCLSIEQIVSYGKAVGQETFDTCVWAGRFMQAWACPDEVHMVRRAEVKKELGLSGAAKDKQVNAALLQRVGPKGTKKDKGPTYGVASHAWAALGVAVVAMKRINGGAAANEGV
ncbi:hypothetical protein [Stenotrophomonas sp. UBA7606]|uniref:hypothetical protein n=1 Tax=Stenotrophomonas sp. UBA7606 TaxID=1947559 RepID=UPI0025DB5021|nr:hypothetical protein [Stenotrophomonas sp. UBA7606]